MNLSSKKQGIISTLLEKGEFTTSKFLSFSLGISVRSVKHYISEINLESQELGLEILSKRSVGYKINILDKSKEDEIRAKYLAKPSALPYNSQSSERVDYIIKTLLKNSGKLRIDDILDALHISIHSLSKDMFSVKMKFNHFRIKVLTRSDQIFLEGSETDIRLCIREYLYEDYNGEIAENKLEHPTSSNINSDMNTSPNLSEIKDIIVHLLNNNNYIMSPFVLNSLALHVYLGICRFKRGHKVILHPFETRWQLINNEDLPMKLSENLCNILNKKYKIELPTEEIAYYALHFKCKLLNSKNQEYEMILAQKCVMDIIEEIQNNFGLDFSDDVTLIENLVLHIPPMITRIKAHIIFRNPEVTENLRQYLFATKITHSACQIIKKYYDVHLDINEFGYLVLYFQMALTHLMDKNKYHIGVIIQRGRAEQLMYFYEIRSKFQNSKYHFEILDLNKSADPDFQIAQSHDKYPFDNHPPDNSFYQNKTAKLTSLQDYDMIISTDDIKNLKNSNIYIINGDNYLAEISKSLEILDFKTFSKEKYFRKSNFITNWSVSNKSEADKKIFHFLWKNKYIKDNVKEFSEFDYTELGKGLVHLQDTNKILSRTICLVIVLKESIYWNNSPVRVIMLTKTKRDTDLDLYGICSVISRWAKDDYNIIRLLENKNFEEFLTDLG